VTPRMAAANGQWGEKQRPSLPLSICSGSELSLSKATCEALQDIRLLGTGTGRSAWEARVSGNVCEHAGEVCEQTVVRKSRSSMGDQTVAEADENSMREAKLMKLLQIQYGTAGSMRFYGVCCDEKFAGSGMSMVVDKLKPVLTMGTRQAMASPRSNGVNKPADALQEHQLHAFAERMANFSEGPMVLHDFKWSSLGLNKQGQVHGIDIAYVCVLNATPLNKKRALEWWLACLKRSVPYLTSPFPDKNTPLCAWNTPQLPPLDWNRCSSRWTGVGKAG